MLKLRTVLIFVLGAASACAGNATSEQQPAPATKGATLVSARPAQAPATVDRLSGQLGRDLHALLTEAAAAGFGGAIIAEVNGEVILQAGYGYADRERGLPYTAQTVHALGSITKPFTAAAILHLAREGKLDLQAPVSRYLPGAAEPGASLTLHHLLTHTSGMVEYCGADEDEVTKAELLTGCLATPLAHPPGEKWTYSNPAFNILAAIAEEVSGEQIDDYLKSRFFLPLGLDRTGYTLPRFYLEETAKYYVEGRPAGPVPGREVDGKHWYMVGTGGIQSSAVDMYHWYLAMDGRLPFDRDFVEMMLAPRERRADRVSATYGWVRIHGQEGEPTYIGHGGSDGSYFTDFLWRPQDRVFVYFTGNNGEDEVLPLFRRVRAMATGRESQL